MSLTSYRAAPPRVGWCGVVWDGLGWVGGPGGDRLSRDLCRSTMGAGGFHGRVRDGIGCRAPAGATRSSGPPRGGVLDRGECGSGGVCGLGLCRSCGGAARPVWVGGVADCCAWWVDDRAYRAIRTGQLRALPHFHIRPIDVLVLHGPQGDLVLRGVSRLDAFSGYPVRT